MKMKLVVTLAAVATAAAFAFGCSSSSNSNGLPSGPSCQGGQTSATPVAAACTSCIESKCSSQTSAVESACSSYLKCFCACAEGSVSCYEGCMSDETSACSSADTAESSCETSSCGSECGLGTTTVPDAGGGSSTPTGTCLTLEACCTGSGMSATVCSSVVSALNDNQTECTEAMVEFADGGANCK